jgi:hypothetical protein
MRLIERLQVQRLNAVLNLLQEIAELELASPRDRAKIDRLNAQLNFLLSEDDTLMRRSRASAGSAI